MNTISSLLIPGAKQVLIYGKKLLEDISPEKFCRKPIQDGVVTPMNHPAFHYGHLALYSERIAGLFDLPKDGLQAPQGFSELFKKGCPCHDDREGKIYPSMDSITTSYFNGHEKLLELLVSVPDQVYYKPNFEEASKDRYPTVGSFVLYLLTAHANSHFGQVSIWRRCVGLKVI